MFKIKYMNYKPYEYELLQKELDELGKQGYDCDDLSLFSIFKKKDYPVKYIIEFYKSDKEEKYQQHKDVAKYYEKHTDFGYYPIYSKHHMYVFSGKDNHDFKTNTYKDLLKISDRRTSNTFLLMCLMVFALLSLFYLLFVTQSVTSFLTYGKVICYIGILLLCFYFVYSLYTEFKYTNKIKEYMPSLNVLKKQSSIRKCILVVSVLMIAGGLTEDTLNVRSFSSESHPYLVLSDFGYDNKTEITTTSSHSFLIKDYYSINELSDEIGLVTKEYVFRSISQAESYIQSLVDNPADAISTHIEKVDNLYYGYYEDQLNTIIVPNENKVIILTCSDVFTDDMINTIKDFYK